jgi:hypothetical protein
MGAMSLKDGPYDKRLAGDKQPFAVGRFDISATIRKDKSVPGYPFPDFSEQICSLLFFASSGVE